MITSSKSPLINIYSFLSDSTYELSCQSSVTVQYPDNKGTHDHYFRGTCLLPCIYEPDVASDSRGEEHTVFFHLWGLNNSGIFTALCVAQHPRFGVEENKIRAPDIRRANKFRKRRRTNIVDQFIVPDVLEGLEEVAVVSRKTQNSKSQPNDTIRLGIDWIIPFLHAFAPTYTVPDDKGNVGSVQELLERVNENISKGQTEDYLPMDTCASMAQLDISSGELDEGSSALQDFLASLNTNADDLESVSTLVLSDLTRCPRANDLLGSDTTGLSLFRVHEQLVEYWITNLPLHVPPQARLAKFKIIRQLGVELALNSFGISLQNKATSALNAPVIESTQKDRDIGTTTRESSPGIFSSQAQQTFRQDIYSSLPTPSQTPSMYSQATSATGESSEVDGANEANEDPAVSRLRQYAVSIGFKEEVGKSALLAHWPLRPGSDPSNYSYEAMQDREAGEETGYESARRNKKEEKRRRKRAEKFLRMERERSRVTALRTGSQPLAPVSEIDETREASAASQPGEVDHAGNYAARQQRPGVFSQLNKRTSDGPTSQPSEATGLPQLLPKTSGGSQLPSLRSQLLTRNQLLSSQSQWDGAPMSQPGTPGKAGRKKSKTTRKAGFK